MTTTSTPTAATTTIFDRDGIRLTQYSGLKPAFVSTDRSNSYTKSNNNSKNINGKGSGVVFTLFLDRGENRFNPTFVKDLSNAIWIVESSEHPKCLVITGKGKFFSNGLDLDWMMKHTKEETNKMIESVWKVLARILIMDCRTVAAINGHGFGAGLFLALACDYRIMRTKRGFLNFPELKLGMSLAKGFAELSKAKLSQRTLREAVLTACRYDSATSLKSGIIDMECDMDQLLQKAHDLAWRGLPHVLRLQNFDPTACRKVKIELYTDAYHALMGNMDGSLVCVQLPKSRL